MSTDLTLHISQGKTNVLSWEEKDDIQRLFAILQNDSIEVLNGVLELQYVLNYTFVNPHIMNKAPNFWSETIIALRFTAVMKAARLFDESKDAIGVKKAFNILEQSKYNDIVASELKKRKDEYDTYKVYIEEIRTLRDKQYAHHDKKEFQFWKYNNNVDLEFDGQFWTCFEALIRWACETLASLRSFINDATPVGIEIANDLALLFQ